MRQEHKGIKRTQGIIEAYLIAKNHVLNEGFGEEIDWQDSIHLCHVTESDFLRESAWVVLSSGMAEVVIRRKFPSLSGAFHYWRSAKEIIEDSEGCRKRALDIFRNNRKIEAILSIAQRVCRQGFDIVKRQVQQEGVRFIQSLPFMGPATSYHLAKNIGLDVVKPDRHLLRVAAAAGFETPEQLCKEITSVVGDRVSVVDLVIWRFATLKANYLETFAQ
jgi:hypothetical protein